MKTNFNNAWRKSFFLAFLILASLTLYNCDSDDDSPNNTVDPEEVQNEFEDGVDELPELDDEDIVFEEPDVSSESEEPQATLDAIADMADASSVEDLDPATIEIVEEIAALDLSADVMAEVNTITADDIDNYLDINQELPAGIDADAIINSLPPEVLALLPEVNFSFGSGSATAVANQEGITSLNAGIQFDPIGQAIDGPCEDVYQDAYDAIIADRQATRDSQLATVISNYERRLTEAETREGTRTDAIDATSEEYATEFAETANAFLAAAENVEGVEDEDLYLLAFLYSLEGRRQIMEWYNAASTEISDARTEEEEAIEERRDDRTATVNANYDTAVSQASTILANGVAACHNQGSGS